MRKTCFISLLCIAAVAAVASNTWAGSNAKKGNNPNGKPFVELAGQIIEVEGEISSIQDQVDALVGRVDSLESHQAALSVAIADLHVQNADLQTQIDTNADSVDSLEAQISMLYAEIMTVEEDIAELGDADGSLQDQIDALEEQVTAFALSIDTLAGNLQGSIENNTQLIEVMQAEIDILSAEMDMKQNIINGLCPDGSAIREVLASGSVVCETDDTGQAATAISFYTSHAWAYVPANRWSSPVAYCNPDDNAVSVNFYAYQMDVESTALDPNGYDYYGDYQPAYGTVNVYNASNYGNYVSIATTCMHQD